MAILNDAVIIISSLPFVIPDANRVVSENSNTIVNFQRTDDLIGQVANLRGVGLEESQKTTSSYYFIQDKSLTATIELTTSDNFFNKLNILKTAIDNLIYLQLTNRGNPYLDYVSYWGLRDYVEYGQFTRVNYSSNSNTNLFSLTFEIQSYRPTVFEAVTKAIPR